MFYFLVTSIFKKVFLLIFRVSIKGPENMPGRGPAIVCSNHFSWWDPPLVATLLPGDAAFMAKEELFQTFISRKVISALGGFPVKRLSADRQALRLALEALQEGKYLCLFPEGTRSKTGKVQKPLPGVGFIAGKSQVPVVPVAIKGPYRLFRPMEVKIGSPVVFSQEVIKPLLEEEKSRGGGRGETRVKPYEVISRAIMSNIAEMLGEKYEH